MVPGKSRGEQRPAAFSRHKEVVKKGVTAVASAMEYISQAWGTIMDLARHFTLKDALDVAIVTLLLYSAIKLVRETRAGQLIKGIILLVVLFLISSQFDLLMLNACLLYTSPADRDASHYSYARLVRIEGCLLYTSRCV